MALTKAQRRKVLMGALDKLNLFGGNVKLIRNKLASIKSKKKARENIEKLAKEAAQKKYESKYGKRVVPSAYSAARGGAPLSSDLKEYERWKDEAVKMYKERFNL